MEWTQGVAQAIATSKGKRTPLLVLVEPSSSITSPPTPPNPEPPKNLYARRATNALHKILFSNAKVLNLIRTANVTCIRLCAEEDDRDFASFSAFFKLDNPPPNLFLIAPDTGRVLYRLHGFVSPKAFLDAVTLSVVMVCGSGVVPLTQSPPSPSSTTPNPPSPSLTSPSTPATNTASTSTVVRPPSPDLSAVSQQPVATSTKKSLTLSSSNAPPPCRLRARLPDGRQVERTTRSDTPFSSIRSWLADNANAAPSSLTIATAFPRYVFSPADDAKQLAELSLAPSATLVVSGGGGGGSGGGGAPRGLGLLPAAFGGASTSSSTSTAASTAAATATATASTTADGDGNVGNGASSWRVVSLATGVAGIVSGFVRSFVSPGQVLGDGAGNEDGGGAGGRGGVTGSGGRNVGGAGGQAVRMTERRDSVEGRDGQWMSNGNSTQFGWNPADGDDEQG